MKTPEELAVENARLRDALRKFMLSRVGVGSTFAVAFSDFHDAYQNALKVMKDG